MSYPFVFMERLHIQISPYAVVGNQESPGRFHVSNNITISSLVINNRALSYMKIAVIAHVRRH